MKSHARKGNTSTILDIYKPNAMENTHEMKGKKKKQQYRQD